MNQLKQTLELTFYGYDPNEFLPITIDGELENKASFLLYKAQRALGHIGINHDNIVALGNRIDKVFTDQGFLPN